MPITEKGELVYGLEIDGARHYSFEMRLPTMADMEDALESLDPRAGLARAKRLVWARCLVALGPLSAGEITPEHLAGLCADDYGTLDAAEERLKKKLLPVSASSGISE